MRRRPGLVVGALVAIAVLFVLFAPGPDGRSLPPATNATPSTTAAPAATVDPFSVALDPVPGQTTVPPLTEQGRATLAGAVAGPEGLLAGATVRIERLVGDQVQQIDVATGTGGRFRLEGVPGGRYRVRAFQAPMFTMTEPSVFFLPDGEERQIDLLTSDVSGTDVQAGTTPASPFIGQGVNLAVRISQIVVDADGVARQQPVVGAPVRISSTGWIAVDADTPRRTNAAGVAVFSFSCERVSSVSATAVVGPDGADQELYTLEVPPCAPRPTTTTSTSTPAEPGEDEPPSTTP